MSWQNSDPFITSSAPGVIEQLFLCRNNLLINLSLFIRALLRFFCSDIRNHRMPLKTVYQQAREKIGTFILPENSYCQNSWHFCFQISRNKYVIKWFSFRERFWPKMWFWIVAKRNLLQSNCCKKRQLYFKLFNRKEISIQIVWKKETLSQIVQKKENLISNCLKERKLEFK